MSDTNRRVHAVTAAGTEIVRYDRAGKWYFEFNGQRTGVTFKEAVANALSSGADVRLGIPGGGAFDRSVAPYLRSTGRMAQEEKEQR